MADAPKYSDADVRAILDRALQGGSSASVDGTSHADLLAIGEQIGVPAEALTQAARELAEEQRDGAADQAIGSRRRRWLAAHAAVYALLNGLFFAVNFLTTPGEWWSLFPIVLWGLALALHAGLALGMPISPAARTRERRRLEAKQARSAPRLRVAASPSTRVDERAPNASETGTSEPAQSHELSEVDRTDDDGNTEADPSRRATRT